MMVVKHMDLWSGWLWSIIIDHHDGNSEKDGGVDGDGDDADDGDNEEAADEGDQPGNHWAATQEPQQPNLRT